MFPVLPVPPANNQASYVFISGTRWQFFRNMQIALVVLALSGVCQCSAATAAVKIAVTEIGRLGVVAMKDGESLQSHRKMDKGVEEIVRRFNAEDTLLELAKACLKEEKALDCAVPRQMHCMAYDTACELAAFRLGEMGTAKAQKALLEIRGLVSRRSEMAVFVQEDLDRCGQKIARSDKRRPTVGR